MLFTSYAQNFEDVMLKRALHDIVDGFYIDVGANDPVHHSVTYAFYQMGWSGINIEPVDFFHKKLLECRDRDINLRIAVSDMDGMAWFNEVIGSGLSTMNSAYATEHRERGFEVTTYNVDCKTLTNICDEYVKDCPVHFLKIDVEGAEQSVISGHDFTRYRPWIILVESTKPLTTEEVHHEWERILTDNHYTFVYFDGLNRFYLANEHSIRKAAFSFPPDRYRLAFYG